jgi:hypothetical protein
MSFLLKVDNDDILSLDSPDNYALHYVKGKLVNIDLNAVKEDPNNKKKKKKVKKI